MTLETLEQSFFEDVQMLVHVDVLSRQRLSVCRDRRSPPWHLRVQSQLVLQAQFEPSRALLASFFVLSVISKAWNNFCRLLVETLVVACNVVCLAVFLLSVRFGLVLG